MMPVVILSLYPKAEKTKVTLKISNHVNKVEIITKFNEIMQWMPPVLHPHVAAKEAKRKQI